MTTTQQYLDYSLLSFAAYAESLIESGSTANIVKYVDAKYTQSQAEKFIASGWEVVRTRRADEFTLSAVWNLS
jgi:hypothetical protein